MKIISIFTFVLLILCGTGCRKKIENPCDFTIEYTDIPCVANDTDATVNSFVTIYYGNSNQVKSEGTYMNGMKNGEWKTYYPNGNLKFDGKYRLGQIDGFWNIYYENGNLHSHGQFEDCQRISLWNHFYEDRSNALKYEGGYANGKKTGTWKSYTIEGKLNATYNCSE